MRERTYSTRGPGRKNPWVRDRELRHCKLEPNFVDHVKRKQCKISARIILWIDYINTVLGTVTSKQQSEE